ncbi:MAG TPA: PxKF domain-containing protein [Gemmatimonadaceae bacterium]|nr:PxKF domain-containing protein [Gemmatimonadaceae bacterium]
MRRWTILPLALLGIAASCDDGPTSTTASMQAPRDIRPHLHHTTQPSITSLTVTGDAVSAAWSASNLPSGNETNNYVVQLVRCSTPDSPCGGFTEVDRLNTGQTRSYAKSGLADGRYQLRVTGHDGGPAPVWSSWSMFLVESVVTLLPQTVTIFTPLTVTYGDGGFAVSASASSGLPVTLSVASGPCTLLSQTSVRIDGAGACVLEAVQEGNVEYEAAGGTATVTILKYQPVITLVVGGPYTYDAQPRAVQSATIAGVPGEDLSADLVVTYDGGTTPPTNAGTYAVVAAYEESANYLAASATGSLVIEQATPTITWTPLSPIVLGTALSGDQLDAVATGVGGAALQGTYAYDPPAGTVITTVGFHTLGVTFTPTGDDAINYTAAAATRQVQVIFPWTGFFRPIDNLPAVNVVKAGSAIPVKFSLGGDRGLGIMAGGYPKTTMMACEPGAPEEAVEETVTAGGSSLTYDPVADQYVYVWKTENVWVTQCRKLIVRLIDGTEHVAQFRFAR